MGLYDIASQHVVAIKARLGIWLCGCSQRRLKDIKVTLQSVIYCDYFGLVAQKCEKMQWGPTRYVSFPTAVNILKCVLLDRELRADTTDAQLLFHTNSDGSSNNYFCDHLSIFLLEERFSKCNKTSNHQTFCSDIIHFYSCSINFPYSVANKRDDGMRARPLIVLAVHKEKKIILGIFFL